MSGALDTWLVTAVGGDGRVLLLGSGWDAVARALATQGVDVAVDRPAAGDEDWPEGVTLVPEDDPGSAFPVVGVALDGDPAGRLDRAVAAGDGRVVTRLDVTRPVDLAPLVRPWRLAGRSEVVLDHSWLASWDLVDEATHDLPGGLLRMLHTTTQGLEAVAEAALQGRDEATRTAGTWRRREAAANARAQTTLTLANRWSDTRDAMVESLMRADREAGPQAVQGPAIPASTSPGGLVGALRSWVGRSPSVTDTAAAHPNRSSLAPGWRVACVAGVAAEWLAGWVEATVVSPAALPPGELVDAVGGHLDVLVVGPVDPALHAPVGGLVSEAREAGAAVVGVAPGGTPWPGFEDLCDVVLADHPDRAGPRTLAVPAPVDVSRVNPTVGFRSRASGLATVLTGSGHDLAAVREAVAGLGAPDVELLGAGTDRGLPPAVADRARQLRPYLGVVDVPSAHASLAEHARTLVGMTAAGVAVSSPMLPDAVADMLGPPLARAVTALRPEQLDDPHVRERHSVRQRRAALWSHGTEARWRRLGHVLDLVTPPRPPVSAVVVTNRPSHLDHCAEQLARQTYRPLEVVVGLHGDAFSRAAVEAFEARVPVDVTIVPVDGHRTLGEGLNLACQVASGTILAKWDDDDHYGPDHLVDLVQALDYSGATIVGKGSEFVHLGQLDVTIRRFVGRAESGSRSLAGGTLALRREDLAAAGWWRRVPRAVDQKLLDDVQRMGGRVHRTHGYGFVLARRADGHTWSVDVDYFLSQSQAQWRGLAREAAGLDDRVLPVPRDQA